MKTFHQVFPFFFLLLLYGCSSGYYEQYQRESELRLIPSIPVSLLTEGHLSHLPSVVQKYIRNSGSIGKPLVHNLRLRYRGEMRRTPESRWLEISAELFEFFRPYARMFYIESSLYGIPFDGFHAYRGDSATMQISVASFFTVADARGDSMTASETVTLFNDMCVLAPATLIDSTIRWQEIDSLTVSAQFTNHGYTISAELFFDTTGNLVNFFSDDRCLSEDGTSYTPLRWSTPVSDYKVFSGRTVPAYGEAIWHLPEGEFTYARFEIVDIEFNCSTFQ